MFEFFVETMATQTSWEEWASLKDRSGREPLTDAEKDDVLVAIMGREQNKFHGWLLFATSNVSREGKQQQFFTTAAASFHGLSRLGMHQQAQLGYMMKATMFDRLTKNAIEAAHENTRCCDEFKSVLTRNVNKGHF